MSFFTSLGKSELRNAHDGAIKVMAKWFPEAVTSAQMVEWEKEAAAAAQRAAKARTDANSSKTEVDNIVSNINRFTAAAEKLLNAGNESAADTAANTALEWQERLESAKQNLVEAERWAAESLETAQNAQRLVMEGKAKLEKAARDQERAKQDLEQSERRKSERERAAGINHGLNGVDVALSAMDANTKALREQASANNIRSDVLGKATATDAAIKEALNEVDGTSKPMSVAEKLALLKK